MGELIIGVLLDVLRIVIIYDLQRLFVGGISAGELMILLPGIRLQYLRRREKPENCGIAITAASKVLLRLRVRVDRRNH